MVEPPFMTPEVRFRPGLEILHLLSQNVDPGSKHTLSMRARIFSLRERGLSDPPST